jgi:LAO/AO transport system kinase
MASALTSTGLEEVWGTINSFLKLTYENGHFKKKRITQSGDILKETIEASLLDNFFGREEIKSQLKKVNIEIQTGKLNPYDAAEELLRVYFGNGK